MRCTITLSTEMLRLMPCRLKSVNAFDAPYNGISSAINNCQFGREDRSNRPHGHL
jgi:hypothetical protein